MRPYRGCRSGRTVRAREATKVFNIQPAMTPRCHQFSFHSGRNDNDLVRIPLISNRPCCSPPLRFGVWNARSLKTKVSSLCDLMLSCSLDLLSVTESWLTSNDSITIADLTNSLEDYAFHHLPSSTRRGGGLAVIARKGLHVSRNEGCIFSSFEHFDSTITSGNKVFRLLKVHLPPPSKKKRLYSRKVFLRILCVIRRVYCYFLSIPSLWWFQLSRRYRLKCKRQTILWPFSLADMSSSVRAHWEHTLELVAKLWKSRLCCEMLPYVGGSCIGVLWPSVSCGIVGWRLSIWFGCRYYTRLSQWKPPPDCLRVTNSERTRQSIQLQHQICSIEAKYSGWCVITTALALHV